MSRTIESQLSINEARERLLTRVEPVDPVEVSLGEALGLVLAEPVRADVDSPPFDRATRDGYAVRADEATPGALLRVVASGRAGDPAIEAGEAARVLAGDPMPPGADSVVRPSATRPDPDTGPTRVIEILAAAEPNRNVTRRGTHLSAGATILQAGTRIRPAMVPLLAAQGCVHPFCHRRVRVSVVTVGDQWVGPAEAPTMNRERHTANAALVALATRAAAMAHDFQAVTGPKIRRTLERAATSPVVVVLGAMSRPLGRALRAIGYEPVVAGITDGTIGRARAGVIRDDEGRVVNHIVQLPADPIAATIGFVLLVQPLIARLQGDPAGPPRTMLPLAAGATAPPTRRRSRVIPASVRVDLTGRTVVEPIPGGKSDLLAWSRAEGLILLPERSGPWHGGDPVEFVPIVPQLD